MGAVRCRDVLPIVHSQNNVVTTNGRLLICKAHTADPVKEGDEGSEDVSVGAKLIVGAPLHPNE